MTTFKNLREVAEFSAVWAEMGRCIYKDIALLPDMGKYSWVDHEGILPPTEWDGGVKCFYLRNYSGCIEVEMDHDYDIEKITLYDEENNVLEVLD